MNIEQNARFTIYFGDTEESVSLDEISSYAKASADKAAGQNTLALQSIARRVQAQNIAFLRQEHGVQGKIIEQSDDHSYFFQSVGDYLITQKKDYGIGVVTADCLPIVIYDPVTGTAGIVHAGWKGLVAGAFEVAVTEMVKNFGTRPENLEIHLGPAARPCCYEVQQDFVDQFIDYQEYFHTFFMQRDGKIYFDSRYFVMVIARNLGIQHENLYTRYNVCTICNLSFCSYRREKENVRRQVTMICLH